MFLIAFHSLTRIIDLLLAAGLEFEHPIIYKIIQGDLPALENFLQEKPDDFQKIISCGEITYAATNGQLDILKNLYERMKKSNSEWSLEKKYTELLPYFFNSRMLY